MDEVEIKRKWSGKQKALIVVLVLLLAAMLWLLVNSIVYFHQNGGLHSGRYYHNQLANPNQRLAVSDIQTWMTFDYINHVFNLPADYLKKNLSIADTRYPMLQLSRYARVHQLNSQQLLTAVKQAVQNYSSH